MSSWEGVRFVSRPFAGSFPSADHACARNRNHQANSYLRDQMKPGHLCLFYASNCKTPGVTGIARVVKEGYPDHNAWDEKHPFVETGPGVWRRVAEARAR